MNVKRKAVELKTSAQTVDPGAIQKAADFVKAILLGFEMKVCCVGVEDCCV